MRDRSASGFDMRRVLSALDLLLLGIGCIIGAGIVVLTGVAARNYAGCVERLLPPLLCLPWASTLPCRKRPHS
jgi:amino acid transporter